MGFGVSALLSFFAQLAWRARGKYRERKREREREDQMNDKIIPTCFNCDWSHSRWACQLSPSTDQINGKVQYIYWPNNQMDLMFGLVLLGLLFIMTFGFGRSSTPSRFADKFNLINVYRWLCIYKIRVFFFFSYPFNGEKVPRYQYIYIVYLSSVIVSHHFHIRYWNDIHVVGILISYLSTYLVIPSYNLVDEYHNSTSVELCVYMLLQKFWKKNIITNIYNSMGST